VPVNKISQFEEDLLYYVAQNHPELKKELAAKPKIDDALAAQLKQIITTFKEKGGFGAKP
jgi:F-type H+-transporting ATPase subunit alpha